MTADKFSITETFLNARTKLTPRSAVAALILDERERMLFQLRDDKEEIFFPNHWSCFGGAVEEGEELHNALVRELEEELGVLFPDSAIERSIHIAFQPKDGAEDVERYFFIVRTSSDVLKRVVLGEGSALQFFDYAEIMRLANITPYDKFAAWLYYNRGRM